MPNEVLRDMRYIEENHAPGAVTRLGRILRVREDVFWQYVEDRASGEPV